jgi:predicted Fe-Mo cluster-binding NifX family protein
VYKIAIATDDGVNINLHFGTTNSFEILSFTDEGEFLYTDVRKIDFDGVAQSEISSCGEKIGGGCCCGGGISPKLSRTAKYLSDCEFLLAATIGQGADQALAREGITGFQISGNIFDAADKINAYKQKRQRQKKLPPNAQFEVCTKI